MRLELNLATRPTRNERRFFVLAGTGAVVLLVLALVQSASFARDWWRERDLARQTERLRAETARLEAEQQRLDQDLKQPHARDVIERARFFNSLIVQKSVSWTQIFMDLEKLIPDRVQVQAITPEILDNNQVRLDMNVAGESILPLLEFVKRVEASDRFGMPVLSNEVPPALGVQDPATRLGLTVLYEQK